MSITLNHDLPTTLEGVVGSTSNLIGNNGYAGTGKTTLQRALCDAIERKRFYNYVSSLKAPYVRTVHKSQGMTVDHVYTDAGSIDLCRRFQTQKYWNQLAYVALTRARHFAVLMY